MVLAADPVAGWASAAMAGRAPAPAATVAPGRGEVAHPTPGRHRRAGSARNHPSELHHAALRGRPVPHRRPRVREAGRLSRPTRLLPGGARRAGVRLRRRSRRGGAVLRRGGCPLPALTGPAYVLFELVGGI